MNNSFLYTNVLCLTLNNCCLVSQTATVSEVEKRKKWARRGFFQYTNITQETFPDMKQDKKMYLVKVFHMYVVSLHEPKCWLLSIVNYKNITKIKKVRVPR